eukprot:jgi/Chlat1/7989/Chrsp7S07749
MVATAAAVGRSVGMVDGLGDMTSQATNRVSARRMRRTAQQPACMVRMSPSVMAAASMSSSSSSASAMGGASVVEDMQLREDAARAALREADCVCMDVDSTVCIDEGIDELAAHLGVGEAVAELTARAMEGGAPFHEALAARLNLMRPSRQALQRFLAARPPPLSPGVADLVHLLHARGAHVWLVSGGFREMVEPAADMLGIPTSRVRANRLLFDEQGEYVGFDPTEPTSRAGGKARAVAQLRRDNAYRGPVVMLGDGATDLEARQPGAADVVIGYGGMQVRPTVKANADWFVTSFQTLIDAVK